MADGLNCLVPKNELIYELPGTSRPPQLLAVIRFNFEPPTSDFAKTSSFKIHVIPPSISMVFQVVFSIKHSLYNRVFILICIVRLDLFYEENSVNYEVPQIAIKFMDILL